MIIYELAPIQLNELFVKIEGSQKNITDPFVLNIVKRLISVIVQIPIAPMKGIISEIKINTFLSLLKDLPSENALNKLEKEFKISRHFFESCMASKNIKKFDEALSKFKKIAETLISVLSSHELVFVETFKNGLEKINPNLSIDEIFQNTRGTPYFKIIRVPYPPEYGEPGCLQKTEMFLITPTIEHEIKTFNKFKNRLDHKDIIAMAWVEGYPINDKYLFVEYQTNKIKKSPVVETEPTEEQRKLMPELKELIRYVDSIPDEINGIKEKQRISKDFNIIFLSKEGKYSAKKYPIVSGFNIRLVPPIIADYACKEYKLTGLCSTMRKLSEKLPELNIYTEIGELYGGKPEFIELTNDQMINFGPRAIIRKNKNINKVATYYWRL